jgi:penicillin-binding protein 1A
LGKRWVKLAALLLALPLLGYILLWLLFAPGFLGGVASDLRAAASNQRARDRRRAVQAFARERRVQLAFEEYPPQLIRAFLAAEDRTFFSHGGIDYPGIVGAFISNIRNDGRPVGASTITQQVAKNLLLTNEVSYTRKIKEAFLARRIENVLTKEQILELYLNQIFLGRNAYGVQSAGARLFRQGRGQSGAPRNGLSRDPAQGTEQLQP